LYGNPFYFTGLPLKIVIKNLSRLRREAAYEMVLKMKIAITVNPTNSKKN
jgi:hypothetical protein